MNGISFIKIIFIIQLFEQPPQSFDITIVIRDIRVLHIYPISHTVCQVFPFTGKFHHVFTTSRIIIGHRNGFTDVFFGDTQSLFNPKLNGQPVSIPPSFTLHMKSLHGFVPAEYIFNGTGHHMVNTRHTVGRRRTFVKYE